MDAFHFSWTIKCVLKERIEVEEEGKGAFPTSQALWKSHTLSKWKGKKKHFWHQHYLLSS